MNPQQALSAFQSGQMTADQYNQWASQQSGQKATPPTQTTDYAPTGAKPTDTTFEQYETSQGFPQGGATQPTQDDINAQLQALGIDPTNLSNDQKTFFAGLGSVISKKYEQNKVVPTVFTQADLDNLYAQAQSDPTINQYYKDQLRMGLQQFNNTLQYMQGQMTYTELQQKQKIEEERKNLSQNAAASGQQYSSIRQHAQQQLNASEAGLITSTRAQEQKSLTDLTNAFEQTYGSSNLPGYPSLNYFGSIGAQPLGQVTGSQEQARLQDVRSRQAQLVQDAQLKRQIMKNLGGQAPI